MKSLFKRIASIFKKKENEDEQLLKEMAFTFGNDSIQYSTEAEEKAAKEPEPVVVEEVVEVKATAVSHGGEIEKHVVAKKPAAKKPAAKKSTAKKATTAKKNPAKKATAAKKPATKKPSAKKATAKKTTKK